MNMFRKNRKGFTLIELIIVIAILAILAAIAIPTFAGIIKQANDTVNQTNASNIATAYNAYRALYPNDTTMHLQKAEFTDAADLATHVGVGLWPKGLETEEAQVAFADWLNIVDGVADVVPLTTSGGGGASAPAGT